MVQWVKGGIYGVIEKQDSTKVLYMNVYGDLDETSQLVVELKGDRHTIPVIEGKAKAAIVLDDAGTDLEISAEDMAGEKIGLRMSLDGDVVEGDSLRLEYEIVKELGKDDIPQVFLTEALPLGEEDDKVSFESFRKSDKGEEGMVLVESDLHESESTDLIVFKGLEALIGQKEHRFYETASKPGVREIEAHYTLKYLTGHLLLQAEPHEAPRAARVGQMVGIDARGMLQGFPYQLASDLAASYIVSGPQGPVFMGTFATSYLEGLLLTMRSPSDFTTEATGAMMSTFYYEDPMSLLEVTLEGGDVFIKEAVDSWKKDTDIEGPKVLRYKSENHYHVKVTGEGAEAAIAILSGEDTVHFDIMDMTDGEAHFIIKEGFVEQGQTLLVTTRQGDAWSADTTALITDAAPVYPVMPEIVSIETTPRGMTLTYNTPADERFSHARLYSGATVVQDDLKGSVLVMGGLDPLTSYSFKLALVDVEGFESQHVAVDFKTDEEIAEAGAVPIRLRVDNVLVTYKI